MRSRQALVAIVLLMIIVPGGILVGLASPHSSAGPELCPRALVSERFDCGARRPQRRLQLRGSWSSRLGRPHLPRGEHDHDGRDHDHDVGRRRQFRERVNGRDRREPAAVRLFSKAARPSLRPPRAPTRAATSSSSPTSPSRLPRHRPPLQRRPPWPTLSEDTSLTRLRATRRPWLSCASPPPTTKTR